MNIPVWIHKSIIAFGVVFGLLLGGQMIMTFMMTGQFFRTRKAEPLHNPVAVKDWDRQGLFLADGRHVMPAGMSELPVHSSALKYIVERGVEVQPDGRVIGLVRADATCGNSPVASSLVRYDLAEVMTFLRQGTSTLKDFKSKTQAPQGVYDMDESWGRMIAALRLFSKERAANVAASARVSP